MLDHEKRIREYEATIIKLKEQSGESRLWTEDEIECFEKRLELLKGQIYAQLTPQDRVSISRHPSRPRSVDYIHHLCSQFKELFGDRLFADDHALIAGLGYIGGRRFVILAQEKGCDTESRIYRNFGMMHPEGYRKALRVMRLAERFQIPVLSFIDTPGAYPGLAAEERGQGSAIATNLLEMSQLSTPLIVVLIGEGCSGGALGMGMGDRIGMLEHAYYSVISPEGCASILWRDSEKSGEAATALRMLSEDLLEFGVIDSIIAEPQGGAHNDANYVYEGVKRFILEAAQELGQCPLDQLIEARYQKFRQLGVVKRSSSSPVSVS